MRAGSRYGVNLDFSDGIWKGTGKMVSMVVGLEKNEVNQQRSISPVAGAAFADYERTMGSG